MTKPNILLVVLDSVRARNTSLHGHLHDTTPFLQNFARRAHSYERAYAPATWSLPSHVSMFTGYPAAAHGVRSRQDRLRSGETIFDELRSRGYETGVFSENPFLTTLDVGLSEAFDTVEGRTSDPLFPDALHPGDYKGEMTEFLKNALSHSLPLQSLMNGAVNKLLWDYPELVPQCLEQRVGGGTSDGGRFTDSLINWVDDRSRETPWAAVINYMDAHHPYHPADEYDLWGGGELRGVQKSISAIPIGFYEERDEWWKCELLEYLYDGAIRQLDAEVERLVTALESRGILDNTLVVVTADHGEGFGERSKVKPNLRLCGHNIGVSETQLHVPLVVHFPGQREPERVSDAASLDRFPDVVRGVLDGEDASFASQAEILVSGDVGTSNQSDLRILMDNDNYPSDASVVYEQREDKFLKHVHWGRESCTIQIIDAQTSFVVSRPALTDVDDYFDSIADVGIRVDASTDVGNDVESRLSDLGYL